MDTAAARCTHAAPQLSALGRDRATKYLSLGDIRRCSAVSTVHGIGGYSQ